MSTTHITSQSRSYALLGHVVTVVGVETVALLPERLEILLGPGTVGRRRRAGTHTTFVVHHEDTRWQLCDEHGEALSPPLAYADQVAQLLEWLAYSAAIQHADVSLMLHSGAVARRGVAVLLPNVSGAGKTTLTLALALRGWLPLTDDICPLVEVDGDLVAQRCRRCCHLTMPSYDLVHSMGIEMDGPLGGLSYTYRPRRWGKPAPVRAIIIPSYTPDAPTTLVPITQAECLAQLAAMNFGKGARAAPERRRTAALLAARVPGFRLTYSSLSEALDSFGILEAQLEAAPVALTSRYMTIDRTANTVLSGER
jgi:hypothetical protein